MFEKIIEVFEKFDCDFIGFTQEEGNIKIIIEKEINKQTYRIVHMVPKYNIKEIQNDDLIIEQMLYRSAKAHVFDEPYFPTPEKIADRLVELAEIDIDKHECLEPEAGSGAIVAAILRTGIYPNKVDAMEIDSKRYNDLRRYLPQDNIMIGNFLNLKTPEDGYDRIIMNPPFSRQQDIDHFMHAYLYWLNPGGILVSVLGESAFFRSNRKSERFRDFLSEQNAKIYDLEAGAFKESGTNVKTRIVKVQS